MKVVNKNLLDHMDWILFRIWYFLSTRQPYCFRFSGVDFEKISQLGHIFSTFKINDAFKTVTFGWTVTEIFYQPQRGDIFVRNKLLPQRGRAANENTHQVGLLLEYTLEFGCRYRRLRVTRKSYNDRISVHQSSSY